MSAPQPTSQEVLDAVRASGYLMEQEVGTLLESLSFHVETNCAYPDLDEAKSREIDVWASKQVLHDEQTKFSFSISLICECKNNTTPFVFLGRPKNERDKNSIRPSGYLFPIRSYERTISRTPDGKRTTFQEIPAFEYLNLADHHYYHKLETKAVQFCRILRSGKNWEATHGGVFDGIFYPLVKALLSKQEEVSYYHSKPPKPDDWKYITLFFPIVVLHGDLYYLDSQAVGQQPTRVPYVTFVRELKSKKIEGRFEIDFVKMDGLKEFVQSQINPFLERIVEIIHNTPEVFLKKEVDS